MRAETQSKRNAPEPLMNRPKMTVCLDFLKLFFFNKQSYDDKSQLTQKIGYKTINKEKISKENYSLAVTYFGKF